MTKQEHNRLDFAIQGFMNGDGCWYDFDNKDVIEFVEGPETPVRKFLKDNDACFAGQLRWVKYDTCEKALRAAYRAYDYDALDWFLGATVNKVRDEFGNPPNGWVDMEDENGDNRPLKYFLDRIPQKYRTAAVATKKSTKKAAKKAVKRGSSKKR